MPLPDDIVDSILSGTADGEWGSVAELMTGAAQPGTATEMSGLSTVLQQFAAAGPAAATPAATAVVKRFPRRAAAALVGVLLTAGTAAAASGALTSDEPPTAGSTTDAPLDTTVDGTVPGTEPDTTDGPATTDSVPGTDVSTPDTTGDTTTSEVQGPDATGPAAYGLCTAWTNGAPKNTDNPAFSALVAAAEAAGECRVARGRHVAIHAVSSVCCIGFDGGCVAGPDHELVWIFLQGVLHCAAG